jgi:hypothetical protein
MPENLPEEEMIRGIFEQLDAMGGIALVIACVGIIPGICEELFCRGILLSGFNKSLGPRYVILMSAFLFAALHMSPYRFLPQFMLGVFLAVVVLRSRSIWLAMLIHFGHNSLVVVGHYAVEANPDLQRMAQEAATESTTTASVFGNILTFVIVASIAAGLCMLLKPARIKAGSADESA